MEKIYADKNGFYEIKENDSFDIDLPTRRENEDLETFSDRVADFIKNEYDSTLFSTGNTFLRRQVWMASSNPSEEDYNELENILLENDAIVDALQRNGYIGYDRDYSDDNIIKIPTRDKGESIEEFHDRLDQFHDDHVDNKLDDTYRREYNASIF